MIDPVTIDSRRDRGPTDSRTQRERAVRRVEYRQGPTFERRSERIASLLTHVYRPDAPGIASIVQYVAIEEITDARLTLWM
jgi:hypothetical protein